MQMSKRLVACLVLESLLIYPAFAADKVSLFKVITAKDEIVIGLSDDELAKMDGNAAGIAKTLVAKGSLGVWQYAVRKAASGDLEQAPLRKIGLIAAESLRVEPYATPLKVLPIEEGQKERLVLGTRALNMLCWRGGRCRGNGRASCRLG